MAENRESATNWTFFRVSLVAIAFIGGVMGAQAALVSERIPWIMLLGMFVACIPVMLLVIGLQRANPWSAAIWQYPDWSLNPLQLREPLQFFHFTGFLLLAAGLGGIAGGLFGPNAITANNQVLVVGGAGQLAGVHVCTIVFRNKMAARGSDGQKPGHGSDQGSDQGSNQGSGQDTGQQRQD
ncbi:MAG: hypothetical protein KJ054_07700 [Gammaproteobacteria bacterium]|nr:hypothetical protein [Gammaproteobacteria bacterium]